MSLGEAVVLGSGTSNGVPSLAKRYPPEYLSNPKNHRLRPSILLHGSGGNVLVDATPDMRTQLLREDIQELEAVIITHTHADHVMGLDDLRAFSLRTGEPVKIYTSPEYQEDIRRIYPYAFGQFPEGIFVPRFELVDVPETLELAGMAIHTMWVDHGPIPCLALRVGNFAYVTDVKVIPPKAWDQLQGLDDLILDAVRIRPHPNHLHLDAAIGVAGQLKAKRTWFTHLSDDFDHDRSEAALPAGVHLAYDGLRISF